MQAWTVPRDTSQQLPEGISTAQEAVVQDCNQNVLFGHVDLFGNPVKVQGLAESAKDTREVFVPVTERPVVTDVGLHLQWICLDPIPSFSRWWKNAWLYLNRK